MNGYFIQGPAQLAEGIDGLAIGLVYDPQMTAQNTADSLGTLAGNLRYNTADTLSNFGNSLTDPNRAGQTWFNIATLAAGGEGLAGEEAAAGGIQTLDANAIRFSQSSVNSVGKIADSMTSNGWVGDPISVVKMADGGLTTVDNTRVLAASITGTPVQAQVFSAADLIDSDQAIRFVGRDGSLPQTWGEAVLNRIGNQNSLFRTSNPNGSQFIGVSSW